MVSVLFKFGLNVPTELRVQFGYYRIQQWRAMNTTRHHWDSSAIMTPSTYLKDTQSHS